MDTHRYFVTLGMFLIDEFLYLDDRPTSKQILTPQESRSIGGGGTYAAIGARIWLDAHQIGMIVDRGDDFPSSIQSRLDEYGSEMWHFRDHPGLATTRGLNSYDGDLRGYKYLTPRIRLTPRDCIGNKLERSATLHFICSPVRAATILSEIREVEGWSPTTIYEPIPDRCIPAELPALITILPSISILSPNAEEGLSLLSMPLPPTRSSVEQAADKFLDFGVGEAGQGCVIIRSGALGSYVATRDRGGEWIAAYWDSDHEDARKVVDVTGAGNSFLGGLAAGLLLTQGDYYQGIRTHTTFYAAVSASFTIEQEGLPVRSEGNQWNGDSPRRRLERLRARHTQLETLSKP